jgi:hypothetical protein
VRTGACHVPKAKSPAPYVHPHGGTEPGEPMDLDPAVLQRWPLSPPPPGGWPWRGLGTLEDMGKEWGPGAIAGGSLG